jgi:hypothetical protein
MVGLGFKKSFLVWVVFIIFMISCNYWVLYSQSIENDSNEISSPRALVGPKQLLKNSGFSKVSDWVLIDAAGGIETYIDTKYDNSSNPSRIQFLTGSYSFPENVAKTYRAYLNQTFLKKVATRNYPTSIICEFDFIMRHFQGEVGILPNTSPISCDIWLELKNLTSGIYGRWPVAVGSYGFSGMIDPKVGKYCIIELQLGSNINQFTSTNPGNYEFAIVVEITVPSGSPVFFEIDLQVDNVSLYYGDIHKTLVIPNNTTFGPFRTDPGNIIDVDFFSGDYENTSLKVGKYRLNNSGIPGPWITIFKDKDSFTSNWSISRIWKYLINGTNIIDIYCSDEVGNYNDSVQINLIMDSEAPVSRVKALPSIHLTLPVNIEFEASDSISGVDYVELWYKFEDQWFKWYNASNPEGKYKNSPISFMSESDGQYGFSTVAYDKVGNVELGGTPNEQFYVYPDDNTRVDTMGPDPIFSAPHSEHISGVVELIVESDADTNYVEFYYWIDSDGDHFADSDDLNSKWIMIGNISSPINVNEWLVVWDTANYDKYLKFKYNELLVILKAIAVDDTGKKGEVFLRNIEVDNVVPTVSIHTPIAKTAENDDYIEIQYTTDDDVLIARFYWTLYEDNIWNLIEGIDLIHGNFSYFQNQKSGSYNWKVPPDLKSKPISFEIKVETQDDSGNIGMNTVGPIYYKFDPPTIRREGFPINITLKEDFGEYKIDYSDYEAHYNPEYTGDNLKWYVTGNSKELFLITGDNSTGVNADIFTFTSINNIHGTEILTYHLYDPLGLEDTINQKIIVEPVDDPPIIDLPSEPYHVKCGILDTIDLSLYISDIDSKKSDLSLVTESTDYTTSSGLNITFNYPAEEKEEFDIIQFQVMDGRNSAISNLRLWISGNSRPQWIKPFPSDLVLKGNEPLVDIIQLSQYFTDQDLHSLHFTTPAQYSSKNVIVEIGSSGLVTLKAKPNVEGREAVWFRATDKDGAWVDGVMYITLLDIPNPPIIRSIPDMNIHWYNPDSDDGYRYDFSYFIYDPDDPREDLIIWAIAVTADSLDEWIENDPNNNMVLVFKFPFVSAGKTHSYALYAKDANNPPVYNIFDITVIFENWPVEQLQPIEDQFFKEDDAKDNAFDLWRYFKDIDGGTNFRIMDDPNLKINADIDENDFVDLSWKVKDWNTGNGYVELVVIAEDSNPQQSVYAIVRIYVVPEDDIVEFTLSVADAQINEEYILDLSSYLTGFKGRLIESMIFIDDPDHIRMEGSLLILKYDQPGQYKSTFWVVDDDNTNYTGYLDIVIKDPKDDKETEYSVTTSLFYPLMVIIILVLISAILFILITKTKFFSGITDSEILSRLKTTTIKRDRAQKMSEKLLDSTEHRLQEDIMQTEASGHSKSKINAKPSKLYPTNRKFEGREQKPMLPPTEQK